MPTVTVNVRNTNYPIVCDNGKEALLQSLAAELDKRIGALGEVQGKGSDIRLLVMTALMMESEIHELKEKLINQVDNSTAGPAVNSTQRDSQFCQEINNITKHLETIASELNQV